LREFSLIAFGGAAGMHAAYLADELKMKKTIIPYSPANFSAIGGVLADVRYDYVRTVVRPTDDITIHEYNETYQHMVSEAISSLGVEGFTEDTMIFTGTADIRYAGQAWELSIPVPIEIGSDEEFGQLNQNFHDAHKSLYGYNLLDEVVMIVNIRLSAVGKIPALTFGKEPLRKRTPRDAMKGFREVFIDKEFQRCPIYDREKIVSGSSIVGPALIEEYASVTLVPDSKTARIDEFKNIVI
jgi:N-methylhydantoinase A